MLAIFEGLCIVFSGLYTLMCILRLRILSAIRGRVLHKYMAHVIVQRTYSISVTTCKIAQH